MPSYTYVDPSTSDKDAVRFLVGDIDSGDWLVSDEEIDYTLDQEPNVYRAAADVAESIAAKFAREVSASAEGMSYSAQELFRNFMDLAERLRRMAARRARPRIYVGGISWAERFKADQDADKIPTHFRSHMHDNPNAGRRPSDPLRPLQ
jgi:hypothetical protein